MYERIIKRGIDFCAACVLLVLLLPVIVIISLLAWGIQGWPIVFAQRRAGYMGRPFWIYKFRSMRNTRGPDGSLLPDAQRTTRFGKFIRSTSIDELPGLLNVVSGQMSLIGPRALLYEYLPYYTEEERLRHSVRPGMVGLAGVRGRNDQSWESMFAHDVEYVRKCSFAFDVKIFLQTILVVLKRQGIEASRPAFNVYRSGRVGIASDSKLNPELRSS